MRLAWLSPWPPQRSGVAGRSFDVVAGLAARGLAIDVFVDAFEVTTAQRGGDDPPTPGPIRVQSAHDFLWRAVRGQFDLVVYQIGNSRLHEFTWPYVWQWPGLAVLHDARLHHARGRARLLRRDRAGYREEFAWSHPDAPADAAELGVAGFGGTYSYQWPMIRGVIEGARAVAVHSSSLAADLSARFPESQIASIALGGGPVDLLSDAERAAARAGLGLSPEAIAFGVFGGLSAEKRLPQIIRAFAAVRARVPDARLVLGGAPDASADLDRLAQDAGVADAIVRCHDLDDTAFDRAIAAMDITLHLRWPTALETSGPWVRALAAGRATIVTDLAHQSHVPVLDPRTWASPGTAAPIAVAIDILDEDHSLRAAMLRLAQDVPLRDRLGRAARAHWATEHHPDRVLDDYQRVITDAASRPAPAPLPHCFRPDPLAHARDVVGPFGDLQCELL